MVNSAHAPVQEEQENLQGLLDALTDQKTHMESVAQAANLVKQQQDDHESQEAEAQFFENSVLWQACKEVMGE